MFSDNYASTRRPSETSSSSSVKFPASGLYLSSPSLLRTQAPQAEFRRGPETDIQNFQLHELLKNPYVLQLWNQYQGATDKLLQESEEQKRLLQQINMLTAEVHSLRIEISEVRYRYNPNELSRRTSLAGLSLAPSDSVSQSAGSTMKEVIGGSALRPESYQHSVLWNIEDCQQYGLVTEKNSSRPPMEKCIRNGQGEIISASEYNAIKTTARMLVNIHLVPLGTPADPAAKTKTKTYYKKYFLQNFKDVLDKLEAQEPLLTLCAARWKAEHIVANCLTAIVDTEKAAKKKAYDGGGQESDEGEFDAQSAATSSKHQRKDMGTSVGELGLRKKKRRNRGESGSSKAPLPALVPPTPLTEQLTSLGPQQTANLTVPAVASMATVQNQSPPTQPEAPRPSTSVQNIDTNFIYVDASYSSLKDEFIERFPGNHEAINLLDAMQSSPEFKVGKSSDDFTTFLERIKNANPNDPNLSEDASNGSWGHYQFTGGRITCTTVLTSWDIVGGCSNACDLIAAALKTCKVARHLCFERNVEVTSYLSDIYLENVVSKLWDLWKSAGGPICKGKARSVGGVDSTQISNPPPSDARSDVAMQRTANEPQAATSTPSNSIAPMAQDQNETIKAELERSLKVLVKDDLWTFIRANSITLPVPIKPRTKPDLISAILQDSKVLTEPIIASIRNLAHERKVRKAIPPSNRGSLAKP